MTNLAMNLPDRVPTAPIAAALDELIRSHRLARPYPLYRHVASQTGVHATTVLRYHTGYLSTAPAEVQQCVDALLVDTRRGRSLPFDGPLRLADGGRRTRPSERVEASEVRKRMDEVLAAMGVEEHQFLCRYVAERTGLHATSVLRYYHGGLQSAPAAVLHELDRLRDQIASGSVVPFSRSPGGAPVVLRRQTRRIIDACLREHGQDGKAVFRALDRQLQLRPGTVRRIYRDPSMRFVRTPIHKAIEEYLQGVDYDPGRVFQAGQRLHHHMFGTGTVVEKVHKDKVRVEFTGGKQVLLSEGQSEDPYRYFMAAGS
jgi:hypothetical protein